MVASALVLTLAAACGDPSSEDPKPDSSGTPSAAETSSTATPTIGADHVVAMPGPISGVQAQPDIMVVGTEPLSDELVESIEKLDDYVSVERMSLVQTVIENQAFNIAAVDPATYRNFTAPQAAQTQAIWDRVAGGELALEPKLQDILPTDDNDFVTLAPGRSRRSTSAPTRSRSCRSTASSTRPGSTTSAWSRTTRCSCARAGRRRRRSREQLAGPDRHRRLGVPWSTRRRGSGWTRASSRWPSPPAPWPTSSGCSATPSSAAAGSRRSSRGWTRTSSPRRCRSSARSPATSSSSRSWEAALQDVIEQGLPGRVHPNGFAGCYYPRFIAGTTKLSNHSFGLALDINTPGNQRGTVGEIDRGVVAIFKYWGFGWGGDWSYTDPMHFEMMELKNPADP